MRLYVSHTAELYSVLYMKTNPRQQQYFVFLGVMRKHIDIARIAGAYVIIPQSAVFLWVFRIDTETFRLRLQLCCGDKGVVGVCLPLRRCRCVVRCHLRSSSK